MCVCVCGCVCVWAALCRRAADGWTDGGPAEGGSPLAPRDIEATDDDSSDNDASPARNPGDVWWEEINLSRVNADWRALQRPKNQPTAGRSLRRSADR